MLETILGIFSSGGVGAITGLVGAIWRHKQEAEKEAKQMDHELEMAKLNLREADMENKHQLTVMEKKLDLAETESKLEIASKEAEGKLEVDSKETDAFVKAVATEDMQGNSIVDNIRKLMRPVITTYLLIVTSVIAVLLFMNFGDDFLASEEAKTLFVHIINQTVFLTVMAVSFWFGSRGAKK